MRINVSSFDKSDLQMIDIKLTSDEYETLISEGEVSYEAHSNQGLRLRVTIVVPTEE